MSGIGQDATEVQKGQIWSEDKTLREVLKTIGEGVERLACRLQPVLRAPTPPPTERGEQAKEAVPDLVKRLRSRISTAQEIEGRLADLVERLEI